MIQKVKKKKKSQQLDIWVTLRQRETQITKEEDEQKTPKDHIVRWGLWDVK